LAVFGTEAKPAFAASGEIEVSVVDSSSKKPLEGARVVLFGVINTSSLTADDGKLRFVDVPEGLYRLEVRRKSYDGVSIAEFEVLANQRRVFSVALTLHTIAVTHAVSSIVATIIDIDAESAQRRVSTDFADALSKIAGVTVDRFSDPSILQISIRGLDANQTGAQLNGSAVGSVGSQVLRSISPDLFAGLAVDQQSSPGALGGTVNFRTLEPTKTLQEHLAASYATFERGQFAASASGSAGHLGFAVQDAFKAGGGILSGNTFEDQSGLDYLHEDGSRQQASFVKLRWATGSRLTVSGSYLTGADVFDATCDQFVTALPCGYGPNNVVLDHSSLLDVKTNAQLGLVTVVFGANSSRYDSFQNYSNLYVAGTPSPFAAQSNSADAGGYLFASLPVQRHTLTLELNDFVSTSSFIPKSGLFQTASSAHNLVEYALLNDYFKASERWSFDATMGVTNDTSDKAGSYLGSSASLTLRRGTSLNGAFSYSGSTTYRTLGSFSDPSLASVNCSGGGSAIVQGPPDTTGKSSSLSYQVAYSSSGRRGSIKASAYDIEQHSIPFFATLPIEGLDTADIPPGYIDAVQTYYASSTTCPGQTLDPARIFVRQDIYGPSRRNRGITLNGQTRIGSLLVFPTYSLSQAQLTSGDSRLLDSGSPYFIGGQIPFTPMHHAGLTIDAIQGRTSIEWLANAQWTGAANASSLKPYGIVSAGVTVNSKRGRLTAVASNLFQTDSGKFATANLAQPIALRGGGTWLPIPQLTNPRSLTVLYTFGLGGKAPAPKTTASPNANK
jgi:hypothetical protein